MRKHLFLLAVLVLGVTLTACKNGDEPNPSLEGTIIDGTAEVLSSSGRTTCDYVQLWEGGPKWATFNVGATITSYGYLQRGADTTIFSYNKDLAPYYNTANVGGLYAWNNPNLNGRQTTWESVSTGISDVATALWGSNWKTPTHDQLDMLQNKKYGKTKWTWCDGSTKQYVLGCKLAGYKVSGVGAYADKSIFLPAAGDYDLTASISSVGRAGNYWSSSKEEGTHLQNTTYVLVFYSDLRCVLGLVRDGGLSVRAVLAE